MRCHLPSARPPCSTITSDPRWTPTSKCLRAGGPRTPYLPLPGPATRTPHGTLGETPSSDIPTRVTPAPQPPRLIETQKSVGATKRDALGTWILPGLRRSKTAGRRLPRRGAPPRRETRPRGHACSLKAPPQADPPTDPHLPSQRPTPASPRSEHPTRRARTASTPPATPHPARRPTWPPPPQPCLSPPPLPRRRPPTTAPPARPVPPPEPRRPQRIPPTRTTLATPHTTTPAILLNHETLPLPRTPLPSTPTPPREHP